MSELISQYRTLPSTYSNYHQLVTEFNLTNATFQYQPNVHYLKAVGNNSTNDAKTESFHMDAIYVNHGFGASSLSWLPTIPYLLPHTKLVLGHDAPGFGFTDRVSKNHSSSFEAQRQTSYYSISHSAAMGTKLLQNHILPLDDAQSNADTKILLMGHSLGTLTTLRMALQQQNNTSIRQQIVLVSPAVGLRKPNKNDDTTLPSTIITTTSAENINRLEPKQSVLVRSTRRNMALPLFVRRLLQRIGTSVACYGLKRLVGRTNFWRYGLQQMVWNNDIARKNHKHKLRDCDVLRYQWPAIVQDWEIGLVQFTSEQMSSSSTRTTLRNQVGDAMMTEVELIQAVLDLPNVQAIHVIVGSNDRVIPNTAIINFFQKHFPNHINVTIMDGFGHNPFEEDPELFVATIQTIIGE
jgi:pimeloyl-ACP methyl ester carboxylesterase